MTPEILAALIERARVIDAIDVHRATYTDWWKKEDPVRDEPHLPASVEWTAIARAKWANDAHLTRLARAVAADAAKRAA